MRWAWVGVLFVGAASWSCDPLLVEAARPLQPSAGQVGLSAKPAGPTLERAPDVCADRQEGAPCRGKEGVFSDLSICHAQVCIESRCGDGVVDRRRGEFCDDGKNGESSDGCTDSCVAGCSSDADCADPSGCNGFERCIDGACANGERVSCDDGYPQTLDVCVDHDGSCHHEGLMPALSR